MKYLSKILIFTFIATSSTLLAQIVDSGGPTKPTDPALAHWDFRRGIDYRSPSLLTAEECINSASVSARGISTSNPTADGSEETSAAGYTCFGGWANGISNARYVQFSLNFSSDYEAVLSSFNFDVLGYSPISEHPSKIAFRLYKNNVLVHSHDNLNVTENSWGHRTVLLGTGSNYESALGSTDNFSVFLHAYDIAGTPAATPRVGLDNVRMNGVCLVPEPSSSLLLGLGAFGLLIRRKR